MDEYGDEDFYEEDDEEYYSLGEFSDYSFADPGGRSALRAATFDNPREYPCPTCKSEYVLTRKDVELGYQCDRCSDRDEGYEP